MWLVETNWNKQGGIMVYKAIIILPANTLGTFLTPQQWHAVSVMWALKTYIQIITLVCNSGTLYADMEWENPVLHHTEY